MDCILYLSLFYRETFFYARAFSTYIRIKASTTVTLSHPPIAPSSISLGTVRVFGHNRCTMQPFPTIEIDTDESLDDIIARFNGHYTKSNHPDSCWTWEGSSQPRFYVGGEQWAPRCFAMLAFAKLDARGQRLYARCRNGRCVNPSHMRFNGARLYFKAMTENDPPGDASTAG